MVPLFQQQNPKKLMDKAIKEHLRLIIALIFIGMVPVSNTGTIQYINDKTLAIEAVTIKKR